MKRLFAACICVLLMMICVSAAAETITPQDAFVVSINERYKENVGSFFCDYVAESNTYFVLYEYPGVVEIAEYAMVTDIFDENWHSLAKSLKRYHLTFLSEEASQGIEECHTVVMFVDLPKDREYPESYLEMAMYGYTTLMIAKDGEIVYDIAGKIVPFD